MRLLLPVLLVGACALPPDKGDTDVAADTDVATDTDVTGDTDVSETGDTAYVADTDPCPAPLADACAPGETQVCGGACVPGFLATPPSTPGHDPRADCPSFAPGELPVLGAPTPGYFGVRAWRADSSPSHAPLLRNCWGEAESGARTYDDGTCDARWNCEVALWDGGDCTAQASVLGTSKTVRSAAEVAAIQSFTELDTLEIDGRTMTTVSLPNLRRLHHLKVWGNGITSLSLPALTTVEGRVSLRFMPDLETFSAPALTSVGGDWWRTATIQGEAVHIVDLDSLTSLDLHSLAHVGAGLRLLHVPKLAQVELPALAQVMGGLYLQHLDAAAGVSVPALTNVGSHLQLRDLPRLGRVDLPVLQTVGGGVSLRELAALTSISAPTLRRAANVILRESYQVDHVSLPSLERIASSVRVHARTVDLAHLQHVGDMLELGLSGTQAVDLCALEDASRINLVVGDGTPSVDLAAWHGEARELTVQRYGSTSPLLLSAPRIEGLALLTLAGVTEAHLGALTHADGDITLNALRLLRAPNLTDVDTLCVQGVRAVTTSLPGIRVARQLIASYGGELQLPALEQVNWILATDWDRASLPSLTEIGGGQEHEACGRPSYRTSQPNTFAAGSFDLSALAHVQTLNLTSTMASSLPVLESATALSISSTSVVEAPLLSSVVSLTLNGAGPPLHAPNLTTLDALAVSASAYPSRALYELPTLRTVRTIDLSASMFGELRMPDLERVETSLSANLYMVQTLSFPSLVFLKSAHLPAVPHLDLSALVEADELRIGVDFRECERITTGVQPVWPAPMDLRLDALTTVGVLDVMHTVGPSALSFPKLATIHGRFRLIDLPALTRVDLPGIKVIPDDVWITIRNVPALTTASLPNAREVGRLAFWNTGMTTISYPNIRVFHDRISARENTLLRTLSYANVTTAGGIDVGDNPLLDTLDLPALTTVNGDVTIDFNTSLPTCVITPMVATWQISGSTQVFANEPCRP